MKSPVCLLLLLALVSMLALPEGGAAPRRDRPVRPKVLLLIFDPVIEAEGGKRLSEVGGWNDPAALTREFIRDVEECSGGFVRYEIEEERVIDAFPPKRDGFRYADESYLECLRSGRGWHQPDAVDYLALVREFDLVRRVMRREVDEVWLWGMPHSGLYESAMAGRDAYFCSAPPLTEVDCGRSFILMGFNYERGVGEMLDRLGHRTESIMREVYGSWEPEETHAWNRFTLFDKAAPGRAGCGTLHLAPNSTKDYDWANKKPVLSTADDWLNYPEMTGKKRLVSAADWGGGDARAHHKWWFTRLPKAPGRGPDGKLANWWKYVVDFNRYEESR